MFYLYESLIFVGQLINSSYTLKFNSKCYTIYDSENPSKSILYAICDHKNRLYCIIFFDITILSFNTKAHSSTQFYYTNVIDSTLLVTIEQFDFIKLLHK